MKTDRVIVLCCFVGLRIGSVVFLLQQATSAERRVDGALSVGDDDYFVCVYRRMLLTMNARRGVVVSMLLSKKQNGDGIDDLL